MSFFFNPMVKSGLPLIIFVVVGTLGLSHFTGGQVAAKDSRVSKRSERAVSLEEAHKVIVASMSKEMEEVKLKPIHRPPE